ncbi:acyltransferase family protein [Neorhizobium galegae]|uniref:Acyltransferase 3 n=1 Tax=Neorhizobium galegae bv. orientalis str. HAMBI 540 TaxID=1028800 RepID=A0A068SZD4_NEOGA|nr:acyltransferase [Neorhizobium galegae]MCQ1852774.1 acyltransferase [Neorhizobium galegae]CDN51176.1 Acyltransferase 3 [Neorhizobium galegae bv. orientalis str. HAMBI 540]
MGDNQDELVKTRAVSDGSLIDSVGGSIGNVEMRNRAADGLRGIASVVVALSHFVHAFWPALMRNDSADPELNVQRMTLIERVLGSPPATIFFNGHFAVLIFFVLSGFVLSRPAIDGKHNTLRSRAWGRYFRLNIPIAVASLLSWLILTAGLNWNHEAAILSSSDWFGEYFQRDISLLTLLKASLYAGLLGSTVLIPPVWSLKVEFLGSLLLLSALALSPSRRGNLLSLAACSLGIVLLKPDDFIFFLCFFAGAALNYVRISVVAGVICTALGLMLGAYRSSDGLFIWVPIFPSANTAYNAVGAVLLVAAVCRAGTAERFLQSSIPQFLGRISYSLYLLHFIVLCTIASYTVVLVGVNPIGLTLSLAAYLLVTIILSVAFTRYIDSYAINSGHKFSLFVGLADKAKSN